MVCLDASLVGAWLLPEDLTEKALVVRERLRAAGEQLIAPTLLVPEVTDTLRKAVYRKRIDEMSGDAALESFGLLPISLHETRALAESAWAWAKTLNAARLYDMYYLALAEQENCDLWTADGRFARLVQNRSQLVHFIGDLVDEA